MKYVRYIHNLKNRSIVLITKDKVCICGLKKELKIFFL